MSKRIRDATVRERIIEIKGIRMKLIITLLGICFSTTLFAANIPQDSLGAQKYDRMQCIDNAAQNCINSSCLNSDQIDCQDNCRKLAQEKCRAENNE